MPTASLSLPEPLLRQHVQRAVAEVLSTMIGHKATPNAQSIAGSDLGTHPFNISASVGFVGDIAGALHLCFGDDFAMFSTTHMLGLSAEDVAAEGEAVINDAIGELANMTAGSFKNGLCDLGYPCKLTLPMIVRGRDLAISCPGTSIRFLYGFDCAGHRLIADLHLKAEP
jgi:chemotaxis protein CheX